ncbi:MAG: IgGFc-binding protein, partial [Polyangia bacterium]|nr:IgGFc-binding protein [Polyangia bacterium]
MAASAVCAPLGGCRQVHHAVCEPERIYCLGPLAQTCRQDGESYDEEDCAALGKVCHPGLGCTSCHPGALSCQGQTVVACQGNGETLVPVTTCDASTNEVCFLGNCVDACRQASENRSYVGCEYWAVDLDNAVISSVFNAAAQQFAVVVSNPGTLPATVRVERNDAPPGWPLAVVEVVRIDLPPQGLRVINLAPREVDGSAPGTYNTGTHTALTSNAYRVVSNVPIIAYQFSPLDNVQVFSNDASLLVPTSALDGEYLVMGWPQTIAVTNDPNTNFHSNLRAFLTIVGIETGTDVSVELSTAIVGSESIPARAAGETIDMSLGPFDVLNLETGDFGADFTGTRIKADRPVAVFSGSEASDVPMFDSLAFRYCCADHLQHQLFPVTSAGSRFVVARMPSRTKAVKEAGGEVSIVEETDWVRILATENNTQVVTSLPPPDDRFQLDAREHVTLPASCDF